MHLDLAYPDARTDLNRWLPLVKWILAIPHYVVLLFLDIGLFFALIGCVVLARVHRPLSTRDLRLHGRPDALAQPCGRLTRFILVTDNYPPLRLAP